MRLVLRRLLVLTLVMALVGAACGDDDDGGGLFGTTEVTEAEPSGGNDDSSPATTAGSSPATTADTGDDAPPAGGGDIEELFERYQDAALRLTYEVGNNGGAEVMILSQDPNLNPPVSSYTFADEDTKIIQRGNEMIICDASECFSVPGAGADAMLMGMFGPSMLGLMQLGSIEAVPGYDVDTQPVNIAGRDGVCITYLPSVALDPDVESARQCVDNELGFTLLLETTDRGASQPETVMRLIRFDRPQPEDFEPTGPIAEMPGG